MLDVGRPPSTHAARCAATTWPLAARAENAEMPSTHKPCASSCGRRRGPTDRRAQLSDKLSLLGQQVSSRTGRAPATTSAPNTGEVRSRRITVLFYPGAIAREHSL